MELRQRALEVLCLCDPIQKAIAVMQMHQQAAQFAIAPCAPALVSGIELPGHPERPALLRHSEVARRSPATLQGRIILMHAIAHIEFNAINLALDAIWRFDDMPAQYYLDWLQVAGEEGKHFLLIRDWLLAQSHDYGDFPAHQGLWIMCEKRHKMSQHVWPLCPERSKRAAWMPHRRSKPSCVRLAHPMLYLPLISLTSSCAKKWDM